MKKGQPACTSSIHLVDTLALYIHISVKALYCQKCTFRETSKTSYISIKIIFPNISMSSFSTDLCTKLFSFIFIFDPLRLSQLIGQILIKQYSSPDPGFGVGSCKDLGEGESTPPPVRNLIEYCHI